MADITVANQGEVDDSGQVNWRGDQVSLAQGGQSIYKSSTIKLADLGSRKVVGDRVFRYARAIGAIGAGTVVQDSPASQILTTQGAADPADGKALTFYFATANAAGVYDEGYVIVQSGTAANLGFTYKVKTQPIAAVTTNTVLALYDPLKRAGNVTDKLSLFSNPYARLTENTAGTAAPVGIAPITVTTNDYFWLQTWGPCAIKNSAVAAVGQALVAGATGQVQNAVVATTADGRMIIGQSMQVMTASQYGMAFVTIAP